MIIKYTNFSDGVHHIDFAEPVKKLGLDESFFGNVTVMCKMDKSAHQIVLDCDISVNSRSVCDRCNAEYERKITNFFQLSYLFSKTQVESEDFNLRYIGPDVEKIDIAQDVFEYIELAIPMKNLCREDCRGLCPKCGTNLNETKCGCDTSRPLDIWDDLKKLKDKLNN